MVKGLPAGWGTCSRTVTFYWKPWALTCWKDTIAVGLGSGDIVTLDEITAVQTAILSGHTDWVNSLAFFPDGASLVSGSNDKTIILWDVQTGGVVKTFYGHTDCVYSVSISADCTTIASGSKDKTIRLWNIQTEECHHVIVQQEIVLGSLPQILNTSYQYLMIKSGTGMAMVTKPFLHIMVLTLLSPWMALSLCCVKGRTLWSKTASLE